jgi:hypothetical protein
MGTHLPAPNHLLRHSFPLPTPRHTSFFCSQTPHLQNFIHLHAMTLASRFTNGSDFVSIAPTAATTSAAPTAPKATTVPLTLLTPSFTPSPILERTKPPPAPLLQPFSYPESRKFRLPSRPLVPRQLLRTPDRVRLHHAVSPSSLLRSASGGAPPGAHHHHQERPPNGRNGEVDHQARGGRKPTGLHEGDRLVVVWRVDGAGP